MKSSLLAAEYRFEDMEEIKKALAIDSTESLVNAIEKEKWDEVLVHPNNQNKNADGNRRGGQ
jgi:dihydroxyacetone kinase-like predicted kinase